MRRVKQIMGLPISIDIPECDDSSVFEHFFERLQQIDRRFSTYRPDSEVSRYRRGEIDEASASTELKWVIAACRDAEARTEGYFSAWAAGAFDPSGYVKGWAVAEVGKVIEENGYHTYCIGAGGDILARSDSDKKWEIGILDPLDKTKILNKLSISNGAVATSGNYERGMHIYVPKTKQPADNFLSVSIIGPDIIRADVLSTAVFAMSSETASRFMGTQQDYRAIIIKNPGGAVSGVDGVAS